MFFCYFWLCIVRDNFPPHVRINIPLVDWLPFFPEILQAYVIQLQSQCKLFLVNGSTIRIRWLKSFCFTHIPMLWTAGFFHFISWGKIVRRIKHARLEQTALHSGRGQNAILNLLYACAMQSHRNNKNEWRERMKFMGNGLVPAFLQLVTPHTHQCIRVHVIIAICDDAMFILLAHDVLLCYVHIILKTSTPKYQWENKPSDKFICTPTHIRHAYNCLYSIIKRFSSMSLANESNTDDFFCWIRTAYKE